MCCLAAWVDLLCLVGGGFGFVSLSASAGEPFIVRSMPPAPLGALEELCPVIGVGDPRQREVGFPFEGDIPKRLAGEFVET